MLAGAGLCVATGTCLACCSSRISSRHVLPSYLCYSKNSSGPDAKGAGARNIDADASGQMPAKPLLVWLVGSEGPCWFQAVGSCKLVVLALGLQR